ncbi:MAG: SURF1 family protein [Gammaproteobacteria bacterium]|nr:SURF1 family protein [Gammaproteobacteria bacterium]MBQ0839080.1 SURF1 family protein [Gammaproteobacteria bacterium]
MPLTLTAGFWQLHRADEKREILAAQSALHANAPVVFSSIRNSIDSAVGNSVAEHSENPVAQRYLRVIATGDIHPQQVFLIDNRVRGGRPGYEVLIPLKVTMDKGEPVWLMVNRGWLAGGLDRSQLPAIPPMKELASFSGFLYTPFGDPLLLADDIWPADVSPLVIQHFDQQKMQSYLGAKVYPYTLRLEKSPLRELKADWIIVNVQPEKHTAYAVQWFAMAFALVILTVFANSNISTRFAGRAAKKTNE